MQCTAIDEAITVLTKEACSAGVLYVIFLTICAVLVFLFVLLLWLEERRDRFDAKYDGDASAGFTVEGTVELAIQVLIAGLVFLMLNGNPVLDAGPFSTPTAAWIARVLQWFVIGLTEEGEDEE